MTNFILALGDLTDHNDAIAGSSQMSKLISLLAEPSAEAIGASTDGTFDVMIMSLQATPASLLKSFSESDALKRVDEWLCEF